MEIPTTRHYFGVKHGKGPSDSAGANYKKFIKQQILKGKNFENAAELGEYSMMEYVAQSMMHGNKKRKRDVYAHTLKASFFHSEILKRKENAPKLRRLHGCRDWMHSVRNTGIPGVVEWRDYDCCCIGCLTHTGDCSYKDLADDWKLHSLTTHTKKELRQLDVSQWMPSYNQVNKHDAQSNDEGELLSSDESEYDLLSSEDSDTSSDDDVKSLSPEEIITESDDSDG